MHTVCENVKLFFESSLVKAGKCSHFSSGIKILLKEMFAEKIKKKMM